MLLSQLPDRTQAVSILIARHDTRENNCWIALLPD